MDVTNPDLWSRTKENGQIKLKTKLENTLRNSRDMGNNLIALSKIPHDLLLLVKEKQVCMINKKASERGKFERCSDLCSISSIGLVLAVVQQQQLG